MAKKRGRKKKRGPKKKKPIVARTYVGLARPYHIITTNNGIQLKDIYSAVNIDVALKKMKELQEQYNKGIKFPVRFVSNHSIKKFVECDYKLILIKKNIDNDAYQGKMKNEYGRYVDCITDNDNWNFIDSLPYQVEETFWVYGYNPKVQRKDVTFIVDNLLLYNSKDKYFLKQIVIYKNKLLIDSVNGLNMVICKNHQDSVRLYNYIANVVSDKKLKYVTFGGDINKKSYSSNYWFNKIQSLTNWTSRKINQNTTRD